MDQSMEMARIAYDALEEKLGEDIRIIKVDDITVMTDYLVIANGQNNAQVSALVENVEEHLEKQGFMKKRIEGSRNATWTLMDFGDIIVHIFSKEDRLFYDLERLWRDGTSISREDI